MCFFIQVCQWKYLDLGILDITNWGWEVENDIIVPKKTDLEPAPEWLLNFVRCKNEEISVARCCAAVAKME